MVNKQHLNKIRRQIQEYSRKRREIIRISDEVLNNSKKAIFAMQRDDMDLAKTKLDGNYKKLNNLLKSHKKGDKILHEGALRAALEEYVEARLFEQFLNNKKIGKIDIEVDPDVYISGLCDVPGELYRYAVKSATERKYDVVKKCYQTAEEIIGETLEMNLTGYNRNKFDQSKNALNKIEHIVYEVSLKE